MGLRIQHTRAVVIAGALSYRLAPADGAALADALTSFDGLFLTYAEFHDAAWATEGIHPTNRQLIAEWNGRSTEEARQRVALPGEARTRGRRRSSTQELPPDWAPTAGELDQLWDASVACRALWCRYLDRSGTGGEAWIGAARAGLGSALQCTQARTASDILEQLLASYPSRLPDDAGGGGQRHRWRRLRALLLRRPLRRVRALTAVSYTHLTLPTTPYV